MADQILAERTRLRAKLRRARGAEQLEIRAELAATYWPAILYQAVGEEADGAQGGGKAEVQQTKAEDTEKNVRLRAEAVTIASVRKGRTWRTGKLSQA